MEFKPGSDTILMDAMSDGVGWDRDEGGMGERGGWSTKIKIDRFTICDIVMLLCFKT